MRTVLAEAGIPASVTEDALAVDAVLQAWRRRFQKRELGQMALRELGLNLDVQKLDVLVATWAPSNEFGQDTGETMVSTIAQRLGIDPSRASRLVSELIAAGYLSRAVSQQDARRTIVELTELGRVVVDCSRTIKFLVLGDFLKGWTRAEIETYLPLLERFSTWADVAVEHPEERFRPQIQSLKARIAEATPQPTETPTGAPTGASTGLPTED